MLKTCFSSLMTSFLFASQLMSPTASAAEGEMDGTLLSATSGKLDSFEFGVLARSSEAPSTVIQLLAPQFWGFKPGIELGVKMFETVNEDGNYETMSANEWAALLKTREPIAGDYFYNATIAVGMTQGIEGRRATDGPLDSVEENIVFSDFRFGVGSVKAATSFVWEAGVSLRNNYTGEEALLVNGTKPIDRTEPGVYVSLAYAR